MEIKKVGVLGCGLMGSGIAQVAATAGFGVTVLEVEQKLLDKGFAGIEKSLAKLAEKGTLKEPLKPFAPVSRARPRLPTLPIATSSLKPSSRTSRRKKKCMPGSTAS